MESTSTEVFQNLRDAVFSRSIEKLKRLLLTQSSANVFSPQGDNLLGLAAACGFVSVAETLLDAAADINQPDKNDLGYTPLIKAVREGHYDMVKFLVARGADLERGDTRQGTPVLHSCIAARLDILRFLLENGAHVDVVDNRGQTPLHHLCQHAKRWNESVVVKAVNGMTNLVGDAHQSRLDEHTDILKVLLSANADVDRETHYGYTPLHWSASANNAPFVSLLIKAGADIHHANANGYTPLHAGADAGAFESCALLLDLGADPNAPDKYGFTALIGAVLSGHERVVQLLLDYGADKSRVVTTGYDRVAPGDAALDVAKKVGKQGIIDMLKDEHTK